MMEDRKLSEKESLELISRMIQETQESKARYEAYPLLIWGYTTIVISLCIWYGMTSLGCSWQINYLWFALPVISTPASLYFNRKIRSVVSGIIWTGSLLIFGVCLERLLLCWALVPSLLR